MCHNFSFDNYKLKILGAEEVKDIFSNNKYYVFNNSRLNPKIVFGKTSLEQNIFSFNHTYVKIMKDEEFIACIGIGMIENNSNCFEVLRIGCSVNFTNYALMIATNPELINQSINRIKKFTTIAQDKNIVKIVIDSSNSYIINALLNNGWVDSSIDNKFIDMNNLKKVFYIRV